MVTSLNAEAMEFNLGGGGPTPESETAVLSVRDEGAVTRIRVMVSNGRCAEFRTELCGVARVQMVEFVTPSKTCTILKSTLLTCYMDSFHPQSQFTVFLADGSQLQPGELSVYLAVGETKRVENGIARDSIFIDFSAMGHRADGLDTLIEEHYGSSAFLISHLQEVSKSLFK